MDDTSPEDSSRPKTFPFIYATSAYVLLVGVLYLWAYWSEFGINVLEYLGVSDIVRIAAIPLAATVASFVIGGVLAVFMVAVVPHRILKKAFGISEADLDKEFRLGIISAVILSVIVLLISGDRAWYYVGLFFIAPLGIWARRSEVIRSIFGAHHSVSTIISILAVLPIFAYGVGKNRAYELKSGTKYSYVYSGELDGLSRAGELRLIGVAGGFLFVLLPDGQTVLLSALDRTHRLELRQHNGPPKK